MLQRPTIDNAAEAGFWEWFCANSPSIERFVQGPDREPSIYHELTRHMAVAAPGVMPELTMAEGIYVLVLTVDGDRKAMPALDRLAQHFPDIPGWRLQRYRAPMPDFRTAYKGLEVDASKLRVAYQVDRDGQLVHILLLLPGYVDSDDRYRAIGFLSLDHTIGEYNTMMHVGRIDLAAPEQAPPRAALLTLNELRGLIEREFYLGP